MIHDYIETYFIYYKMSIKHQTFLENRTHLEGKERKKRHQRSRKRLCFKPWPLLHRIPAQHVVWAPTTDPRVFNTLFSQIISFPHPFVFMPVILSEKTNKIVMVHMTEENSEQAVLFM